MLASLLIASALLSPMPQSIPGGPDTLRSLETLLEFDPEFEIGLLLDELDEGGPGRSVGSLDSNRRRKGAERLTFGMGRAIEGESSAAWNGSPVRWWLRGELRLLERLDAGVMMEKDAGERADLGHWSGFLSSDEPIQGFSFVIGDFRLEPGSTLFAEGRSSMRLGPGFAGRRPARHPIFPHRSRSEFGYLRGGVLEYASPQGDVGVSAFVSSRNLPGHGTEDGFILERGGTYRSVRDEGNRSGTHEFFLGVRAEFSPCRGMRFSSTIASAALNEPLDGSKYRLSPASRFFFIQADAEYRREEGAIGIDVARGGRGGWGALLSWSRFFRRHGGIAIRAGGRSSDFWDYRQAGGESNRVRLEFEATMPISLAAQLHAWIGHWRRLRPLEGEFAPLRGTSLAAGALLRLSSGGSVTIDLTRSTREEETTGTAVGTAAGTANGNANGTAIGTANAVDRGSAHQVAQRTRTALRAGLQLRLGRRLEWRVKGAGAIFRRSAPAEREAGMGSTQELRWSPVPWCSLSGWMTLYSAPSYECAIYVFEPDPIRGADLSGCTGSGERFGATCTLSYRGSSATLYWSGGSRIPPGPSGSREEGSSFGFRFSSPL